MIIDECKYMRDSHFVNSTELKEKYTYIHTFSKSIIATNRHTAVKCGFVTFNKT